mmetsp:Transcript_62752/g.152788  ORF Transcript_62752/g.152788 Transcript_62752/m.152788 type:complete len:259 (-) Transcript_62752:48-824(-)
MSSSTETTTTATATATKHVTWEDNDRRRDHKLVRDRDRGSYSSRSNPPTRIHGPSSIAKLDLEVKSIRRKMTITPNHDTKMKRHQKETRPSESNAVVNTTSNFNNQNKDSSSRRLLLEPSCPLFFKNLWDEENDMAPPSFYNTDKPKGKTPAEQIDCLSSSFEDLFFNENSTLRPSKDKSTIPIEKGSTTKTTRMGKTKTNVHHSNSTKRSSKSSSTSEWESKVVTTNPEKEHEATKKNSRRSSTFIKLQKFLRGLRG